MFVIKRNAGFTIVELLIVIVVIGILAAITIVAYNGIQNRAHDSAIQNDLNSLSKKIQLAKIDSLTGTYPTSFSTSTGLKVSRGAYDVNNNNFYYCLNAVTDQYALGVASKSGNSFVLTSSGGMTKMENSRIYSSTTCSLVGTTWGGADTYVALGYDYSNGTGWVSWLN